MDNAILVTGGAGYVGSHTVWRLLDAGRRVVVLDDLSLGHREVVHLFARVYGPEQFVFEEVNLLDREVLGEVFTKHRIVGVIDFAARSLVGQSQEEPRLYFDSNVLAFRNLVDAAGGIPIVKSSTCATYGNPGAQYIPLNEDCQRERLVTGAVTESQLMSAAVDFETVIDWYEAEVSAKDPRLGLNEEDLRRLFLPTNVYGMSKMMDELILEKTEGQRYAALRYFNVAGAHASGLIGEDHDPESHLIPIVLQVALGQREKVTIFGEDYDTEDGTAVRDYISVEELADVHVLCLDRLLNSGGSVTYNLGTETGFSVKQIIQTARQVTGHEIPAEVGPRRSGDPDVLVADSSRVKAELGWQARASLEQIIASAWRWHRLNPAGYRPVREERFNPFWGRWINIASGRDSRPWRGEVQAFEAGEEKPYDPDCYLCPGNRRVNGAVNPAYTGVWTFANDFPALVPDGYEVHENYGPYTARASRGVCEVITYGPDHNKRLSEMAQEEVEAVVDAWAEIYERLGKREEINYVLIFENRGTVMGNSQPHPHGQVYSYGTIPDLMVAPQLQVFTEYKKTHDGACFVCDANRVEEVDGRRVLARNEHFVAYVPYAAQLPYDVVMAPLSHTPSLLELDVAASRGFAGMMRELLSGLDHLFGTPYHYSMALIQAPTNGKDHAFHMQVHITSLLRGPGVRKHVVGADIFGEMINPSDPNIAAAEIRQAMRRGRLE
ncbi:MAG: galactose-1-phosphate uridylyltransferase [bacterium]|nr:galactose-1-phosphate uridylyltransferase [bacterium]